MKLSLQSLCFSLFLLLAISGHAYGFGAGNISSLSRIEGQNWRHGDIEDVLLSLFLARVAGGRKFTKIDVKRVYFGNWLRDYSQAVDVGTVKYVSSEAIRILIWVLGFMSFGYGTREFEVTSERLGCYQPTEHIDNPLGYAEGEDARCYDHRLRGPVDEERELSIDPRTGLKNYIASEGMEIDTSASLIRRVLGRSIQMGRRYARSHRDDDLYEALRLLGTGLHCLEDYAAHSNYTELSLIELGEEDVFPHVGRDTKIEVDGARGYVYPVVTGTFGGVDFFHSVLGEFSDKTMQSEIQSLEGVIVESENDSPSESFLQSLLGQIPGALLDTSNNPASQMDDLKAQADDAKRNGENITPREPEEWTQYLGNVQRQIYPILEWHDRLLKAINESIEKIPVLPELVEQVQDQLTIFVFSILAPYVLPIIKQVKAELETGSSEVIQSSREQQHIVFNDDSSSNPTHSMLSKDHFSNVLNEPAGRIASSIVKWVVPQLMQCWDDEADIDQTLTRIIAGVFHHPALRELGDDGVNEIRHIMFSTVEQWWSEKSNDERDSLRAQLSRDGVLEGKNHREGVQDCGHGCGKPLALPQGSRNTAESYDSGDTGLERVASEAVGGGVLGGLLGGLVGGMSTMLLNDGGSNGRESPTPRTTDGQYDDDKYKYRHAYHDEHPERYEQESYGEYPPHPEGYEGQSDDYGDSYSREGYFPGPSPPMHEYAGEEYREYSEDKEGYYAHQRHGVYESVRTEYEQREFPFENRPPQSSFEIVEQGGHDEGLEQRECSPGYDGPRHSGHGGLQGSAYSLPQEERHEEVFEGEPENSRKYTLRHEQRSGSGSGSSSGGSDEEHSPHRHHRYWRHHHHHERSGSEDSE